MKVAPSMMCADLLRLGDAIYSVERGGADVLHMDVMDGHFVAGFTFGADAVRQTCATATVPVEVHLMSDRPRTHVDEFLDTGIDLLIVHAELSEELDVCLDRIRSRGVGCGVALNPATQLASIDHVLAEINAVLVMSVEPGSVGKPLIESSLRKAGDLVVRLRERGLDWVEVVIDGGVKLGNVAAIAAAGVGRVVSGSGLFGQPDVTEAVREMKRRGSQCNLLSCEI